MLQLALAEVRERGCEEVRLASQRLLCALYERAGFTVESEPFEEAGIPHVWMGLRLAERSLRSASLRTVLPRRPCERL